MSTPIFPSVLLFTNYFVFLVPMSPLSLRNRHKTRKKGREGESRWIEVWMGEKRNTFLYFFYAFLASPTSSLLKPATQARLLTFAHKFHFSFLLRTLPLFFHRELLFLRRESFSPLTFANIIREIQLCPDDFHFIRKRNVAHNHVVQQYSQ